MRSAAIALILFSLTGCCIHADGLHDLIVSGLVVDQSWRQDALGDPLYVLNAQGWEGPSACFPVPDAKVSISSPVFGRDNVLGEVRTGPDGFFQLYKQVLGGTKNPFGDLKVRIEASGFETHEETLDSTPFYGSPRRMSEGLAPLVLYRAELKPAEPRGGRDIPLGDCAALTEKQRAFIDHHERYLKKWRKEQSNRPSDCR